MSATKEEQVFPPLTPFLPGNLNFEFHMRSKWRWAALIVMTIAILAFVYIRTHPLVFMDTHAHCIKMAGLELIRYADEHEGKFPSHRNGYGNALLLLDEECFHTLTGPGYDVGLLREAKRSGKDLPDEQCGRVYVQGLTTKSNPEIALLFDKLPTPGGDHCHLPYRLWAPLGREVWLVGMNHIFVRESEWPDFANKQVELLVQQGFDRKAAERLFASCSE